ncbi:PLDc N-terminal domain-containing protein [Mucilaginibacter litoreus]|uniref:PLDc N-terminal domain-containing protein n=1 Tax=Mucilaginibacter litoreus TaxID=1048221 RepID=A0ABW3AXR3_9SPHI
MDNLLFLRIGGFELFLIICVVVYFGLIVFALLDVIRSTFKDPFSKFLWVIVILFFPFLGSILYLAIGRNQKRY